MKTRFACSLLLINLLFAPQALAAELISEAEIIAEAKRSPNDQVLRLRLVQENGELFYLVRVLRTNGRVRTVRLPATRK